MSLARNLVVATGLTLFIGIAPACVGDDPKEATETPDGGGTPSGTNDGSAPVKEAGADAGAEAGASCECALGCTAACKQILPTTAVAKVDISAATFVEPITIDDVVFLDTATGVIERRKDGVKEGATFGVPIRPTGDGVKSGILFSVIDQEAPAPKIAVFAFDELTIGPNTRLQALGPHALALVAKRAITVDGRISVRGDCATTKPGFDLGGFGYELPAEAGEASPQGGRRSIVSAVNPYACGGNGGGGNGTAGQFGGIATWPDRTSQGGAGGTKRGSLLVKPVLTGGGGGGGEGLGGSGGGALTLVASGAIIVGGTIDAGGCHGRRAGFSGGGPNSCGQGAGGGGAGGTVLFEAGSVTVKATGRVLANGGGGGGGANATLGKDGADASSADATPAAGGESGVTMKPCGNGGAGSPLLSIATQCDGVSNAVRASGGGGGAGLIAARTLDGTVRLDTGSIVSPVAEREFAKTR